MKDGPTVQGRQRTQPSSRLELFLAAFTVVAFTAPGMLLLGLSDDPNAPPNPIFRLYWPPIYVLALLLCVGRWRKLRASWLAAMVVGLPISWACASQLWSIMPDDTGRRAFALAMTTVFGFYLGSALTSRRMVQVIAAAGLVLAAGSLLMSMLIPRFGVEQLVNIGCWRGLWDTKNALAAVMTLGALASACAALLGDGHRRLWMASFALCGFDLLMSRGKTALVCLLLGLALLAVSNLARRGPARAVLAAWFSGAVVLVTGFGAFVAPDAFFHAVGKDPTLTGRTEIWTAVLGQVAQRPLTGFGFAAFWNKTSVPAMVVAKQTGWVAPEAHNGWLDLLAQVGWVGAALVALGCLTALAFAVFKGARQADGGFCAIYLVVFLAMSLAESVLLSANNLLWVVFVGVLTQLVGSSRATFSPPQERRAPPPITATPVPVA